MINILKTFSKTNLITRAGIGIIFALPSFFLTQIAHAESETICGNFAPSGYVATGYVYLTRCQGDGSDRVSANAVNIENPYPGQTICGDSAPSGYVVTGFEYSTRCKRQSTDAAYVNAARIDEPYSGQIVCTTVAPSGYKVTQYLFSQSCKRDSTDSNSYMNAARIDQL